MLLKELNQEKKEEVENYNWERFLRVGDRPRQWTWCKYYIEWHSNYECKNENHPRKWDGSTNDEGETVFMETYYNEDECPLKRKCCRFFIEGENFNWIRRGKDRRQS